MKREPPDVRNKDRAGVKEAWGTLDGVSPGSVWGCNCTGTEFKHQDPWWQEGETELPVLRTVHNEIGIKVLPTSPRCGLRALDPVARGTCGKSESTSLYSVNVRLTYTAKAQTKKSH